MLSSGCVPHGWLCLVTPIFTVPAENESQRPDISTVQLTGRLLPVILTDSDFFFQFKHSETFQKVILLGWAGGEKEKDMQKMYKEKTEQVLLTSSSSGRSTSYSSHCGDQTTDKQQPKRELVCFALQFREGWNPSWWESLVTRDVCQAGVWGSWPYDYIWN